MKRIIALLFFTGAVTTSFAQYDQRRDDDHNRGNGQYATADNGRYDHRNDRRSNDDRAIYSERERSYQVDRINREYNYKVMSIQNNRYMKKHQKKLAIRDAQRERERQIQMLQARFNNNVHHDNGRRGNGKR